MKIIKFDKNTIKLKESLKKLFNSDILVTLNTFSDVWHSEDYGHFCHALQKLE